MKGREKKLTRKMRVEIHDKPRHSCRHKVIYESDAQTDGNNAEKEKQKTSEEIVKVETSMCNAPVRTSPTWEQKRAPGYEASNTDDGLTGRREEMVDGEC